MSRHIYQLVSWSCLTAIVLTPVAALFLLFNMDTFASLAKRTLELPIQWPGVVAGQWYGLWLLTTVYLAIGLVGLYFLRRAFNNFARGEYFNQANSRDLKLFSIFLFIQAIAKPLHFAFSSILLSLNHPAGQKVLSISMGSGELKVILLALIMWGISDLLVKGSELESENKQFI